MKINNTPSLIYKNISYNARTHLITIKSNDPFIVYVKIYLGIFIAQGNFSLSGIYPCFFYLIVIAFGEEFIFRGYVFTELREEVPTYLAVIISGMIWGAMHAFMPAILNNYSTMELFNAILSELGGGIVMGAFFVWLYKKTNSLIVPILIHALIDYYPVLFR